MFTRNKSRVAALTAVLVVIGSGVAVATQVGGHAAGSGGSAGSARAGAASTTSGPGAASAAAGSGATNAATTSAGGRHTSSAGDASSISAAGTAPQQVSYLGHSFTVPAGWSVVDLSKSPQTCVRFDVHALYLGTPSSEQKCGAQGSAAVEGAILVSPTHASAAASTTSATSATSSEDDPVEQRISAILPNVKIVASYGLDRASVVGILSAAGVPAPAVVRQATSSEVAAQVKSNLASTATAGATPTPGTPAALTQDFTGLGFDTCSAPTTDQMSAWRASPFGAVGFYFGGENRQCAQPNLTASWVSTEAAVGWHMMPLYIGSQVGTDGVANAAAQGKAEADDAVTQASAIGIGPGALLYYDMEENQYTAIDNSTVQTFLNAWTLELHAQGYESAVYGMETGAVGALNTAWGTITEPDVLDVDNANGLENDDPGADPSNHWQNHRVHQYIANINETYGGVTIQVDWDYFRTDPCGPTRTFYTGVQPQYMLACHTAVPTTSP